jgi:hypothetical protein
MKFVIRFILTGIAFIIFSCSKSDNNSGGGTRTCNFSLPVISASADGSVKYEVKLTGTGQVSQIILKSNGVDSTLNSPGLPFQLTLPVASGAAIGLTVKGSTSGGIIDIEYSYTPNSGGSLIKNEDECGN